jgi:hypothetical protein
MKIKDKLKLYLAKNTWPPWKPEVMNCKETMYAQNGNKQKIY